MSYPPPIRFISDDELVEQGIAIFRSIASRDRAGLCVTRIAKNRFCPRPTQTGQIGNLYCEQHRPKEDPAPRHLERKQHGRNDQG